MIMMNPQKDKDKKKSKEEIRTLVYKTSKKDLEPVEIHAVGGIRKLDAKSYSKSELLDNPPLNKSLGDFAKGTGLAVGAFTISSLASNLMEDGIRKFAKDWYNQKDSALAVTQWSGVAASAIAAFLCSMGAKKFLDENQTDAVIVGGVIATGVRAFSLVAPTLLKYLNLASLPSPSKPLSGWLTKEEMLKRGVKQQGQSLIVKPVSRLERALANRPALISKGMGDTITDKTLVKKSPMNFPVIFG